MTSASEFAALTGASAPTIRRRLRLGDLAGRKAANGRWHVTAPPDARLALLRSMPYDEYEREPGVRWSHLKELRTSPRHYLHRTQMQREETASLALGRATHTAVFEPDLFDTEYVVFDGRRAGKAWDEFAAEHDARSVLRPSERDTALTVAEAVRAHGPAAEILAAGVAEQVVTWTDPGTGIGRKARLDWVTPPDVGILADLKTAADIGDNAFGRAAGRYCYHGQLVDYVRGLEIATGVLYHPAIIAVENHAPYDVRVADVAGAELSAAENLVRDLLDRLAECIATDSWPGQFPERGKLNLPSWELFTDDDHDISDLGIAFEVRGAAA